MDKLIPFFEVNGQRYEIKTTRYLMTEYEKLLDKSVSGEEKANALKSQKIAEEVQKYAAKLEEVEKRYFETFSDADERAYNKIKELYDNAYNKLVDLESTQNAITSLEKKSIDTLEKLVIIALQEQYKVTSVEAENIWVEFVNKNGKAIATEWLIGMSTCLFNVDNEQKGEDNDFLSQLRARNKKKK